MKTYIILIVIVYSSISISNAQKKIQYIEVNDCYFGCLSVNGLTLNFSPIDTAGLNSRLKAKLSAIVVRNDKIKKMNQLLNILGDLGWEVISKSPIALKVEKIFDQYDPFPILPNSPPLPNYNVYQKGNSYLLKIELP